MSEAAKIDSDDTPGVPLALVSNSYLDDLITQMRDRSIPWEGYLSSNLISQEELELIKKIDKKTQTETDAILDNNGAQYARLYVNLLSRLSRVDTLQYILVLVNDMLQNHDERVVYFHSLHIENSTWPYAPFLACLRINDNDFVPLQASKILTTLICSAPSPSEIDATEFLNWIVAHIKSAKNPGVVDIAVQNLESLLRVRALRKASWETPHAIEVLVTFLKKNSPQSQMQYQIIFCFWLLTFEAEYAAQINKKYDIIPTLIEIAKAAIKEKVTRVIIATFRNMVEKAPEANLASMLVSKLLPFCENLATRKWSDPEIVEDIQYLKDELTENFQSLTTFEQYASEVQTGKLDWSPPHQSEQFWKLNSARLNENDRELIRILARILSSSQDPVVLAVACHDIGQYVKYNQKDGKKFIQEVGAKQRIMELMTHEDSDVRYQALLAVQKYMVNAWEF